MVEGNLSDIIRTSLDGIRELTESDTFVGGPIETASGVTIIPVSKITLGFATGGVDLNTKKPNAFGNFGGGGGSGVAITPMAFITVSANGTVDMIDFSKNESQSPTAKVIDFLSNAPHWIEEIKGRFG
jgi:sporulation protein YtfJ